MKMNKSAFLIVAGVVVLGALVLVVGPSIVSRAVDEAPVAATQPAGHVIAVIDAQTLLNDSVAGKLIQEQLIAQRDAFQKEFSKLERELGDEEKKLIADREKLSTEKFAERRRAFEEKLMNGRRLAQHRRILLEKASADAYSTLRFRMTELVAIEAQAKGYDIVLNRQNVVLAEKDMDITGVIMERLNKEVPRVNLDLTAAEKAVDEALKGAEKSGKAE